MAAHISLKNDTKWWETAIIYQIYPRSFKDSNGDGWGDLNGIREKIPYLIDLDVDAVWLSPFYPSPGCDAGYDVADYMGIDPKAGNFDDFDALIAELHNADIKMVIDIVPNHCSTEHRLFHEAVKAGPGSLARKKFHFRDGLGSNGELPPNNWQSHFGGPAWTRLISDDGQPEQWYLHLFDTGQPDFNWDDEEVNEYFRSVLTFWLDRGVDGFRIDVAHLLVKDNDLPDWGGPANGAQDPDFPTEHSPMFGRDEVHAIFRQWRSLLNDYSEKTGRERSLCGEVCVEPIEWQAQWSRSDEMHTVFNFSLLNIPFQAEAWHKAIFKSLAAYSAVHAPTTWVLNNHDVTRNATRLGYPDGYPKPGDGVGPDDEQPDQVLGLQRARAAAAMLFCLPGSIYIYQGEELGLPDHTTIPPDQRQDPTFLRTSGERVGRDGCRVPLPWQFEAKNLGFSTSAKTWLPQPAEFDTYSVELQKIDEESTLSLYKNLVTTRKSHSLGTSSLKFEENSPSGVLAISNNDILAIMNTNADIVDISHMINEHSLVIESIPRALNEGWLAPNTTVWLKSL